MLVVALYTALNQKVFVDNSMRENVKVTYKTYIKSYYNIGQCPVLTHRELDLGGIWYFR